MHGRFWPAISPLAWLFPVAIMLTGAVFPSLWSPVRLGIPPLDIAPGMLTQALLSSVWMLTEYRFAASRDTTIRQLQVDSARSMTLALILTFLAGILLEKGTLPWWYVIPVIASIADSILTPNQGLNNAGQKPFIPTKKD